MKKQSERRAIIRRAMCAAVLTLCGHALSAAAQNWYWIGTVSTNWSDMANWNSVSDGSGSAPVSAEDLTNKNLLLLTTGTNLPSTQDITGLVLGDLMFDGTVTSFELSGEPLTLNRISHSGNPASTQTITIRSDLILKSSSSWNVNSKLIIDCYGTVSETGGSRSFSCNGNGAVQFHGPVTTTGGFRNNQAIARFYGMETCGTLPSTFDADYFYSGSGTMAFNSPDGKAYAYEFGTNVGVQTSGSLVFSIADPVTVTLNAPVSESASGKTFQKTGDGVLYLNGESTFTGGLSLGAGMIVLNAPLAEGNGTANMGSNTGAIDLNGHDVLGRHLTFANSSGFSGSGVIRNSNRSTEALITSNITSIANAGTIIQFGGGGDIRLAGNITHATSSYRLCKTGAGRLTIAGSSVYGGSVQALGGTLRLDYATDNTGKIGDTATLALHGQLEIIGSADDETVETVGPLTVGRLANEKPNLVRISPVGGTGHTATLRFSSLDVGSDSALDFAPGLGGAVLASSVTNNDTIGILAPRITFGGASFARLAMTADGEGYAALEGLPDENYATAFDSGTTYEIVDLVGEQEVPATEVAAALRFNSATAASLTLNAALCLRGANASYSGYQGGLLVTPNVGNHPVRIDGMGTLCGGDVNGWLHVQQYNTLAPLIIGARINNTSSGTSLAKSGPGELVLTNRLNYFSALNIYEGTLTADSAANSGSASALGCGSEILLGTATLKYTGAGDTTDRLVRLRGHGTLDASGSGPLVLTRTTAVATTSGNDNQLTLAGSGEGEMQGVLNLSVGSLRKTGAGLWRLTETSTNSFWGGARIEEGTLIVNGSLGRDVTVAAGGTLAGSGVIGHNLTVAGTLSVMPSTGVLSVGSSADISGATLAVSGPVSNLETVEILTAGNALTGTFANVPENYTVTYTANSVLLKKKFYGTVIRIL